MKVYNLAILLLLSFSSFAIAQKQVETKTELSLSQKEYTSEILRPMGDYLSNDLGMTIDDTISRLQKSKLYKLMSKKVEKRGSIKILILDILPQFSTSTSIKVEIMVSEKGSLISSMNFTEGEKTETYSGSDATLMLLKLINQ